MSVPEASNFRDLKKLLAELDPDADDQELPIEIKRRAYLLCARFLGGAWKTVNVSEMCLTRIKSVDSICLPLLNMFGAAKGCH